MSSSHCSHYLLQQFQSRTSTLRVVKSSQVFLQQQQQRHILGKSVLSFITSSSSSVEPLCKLTSTKTNENTIPPLEHDSDQDSSALQEALKQSVERSLDQFIEDEAPSWLRDMYHQQEQDGKMDGVGMLPFSCTSCGKCCRTKGNVNLAPEDITKASQLLNVTQRQFVQEYCASYLSTSSSSQSTQGDQDLDYQVSNDQLWVRLKNGKSNNACIFLDETTNHCRIYEARPVQCMTYPFWPNILQSPQTWNAECRRLESDGTICENNKPAPPAASDVVDDDQWKDLPLWTPELGGCEGMRLVDQWGNTAPGAPLLGDTTPNAMPVRETCRQLLEYSMSKRRFPNSATEKRI